MQLLKMFTSATTKNFKINLLFISLVLAHPNSVHVNKFWEGQDLIKKVIDITGSPWASLAHSLELMIAILFST